MDFIGVCIFDEPSRGGSGWSSKGGAPAERITDYGNLSNDTIWVTNINYRDYKNIGLANHHNIYDDQFFRTSIKLIQSELGLLSDNKKAASAISSIFTRVMTNITKTSNIQLSDLKYRLSPSITSKYLPPSYRMKPSGKYASELIEVFKQSTQQNQHSLGVRPPKGSQALPFCYPRATYYKYLLTLPVPSGNNWKPLKQTQDERIIGIDDGTEIKGTKSFISKLTEWSKTDAIFLKIKVYSTDPEYSSFATFGHGSWEHRQWASLPEVIELSKFSKIGILKGYQTTLGRLDLPEEVIMNGKDYSYSYGLFLENIWNSISSPIIGTKFNTAIAAYMRAYDRIFCLRAAHCFTRMNYLIGSSGSGRVMVYSTPSDFDDISRIAIENNLLPPLEIIG